MSESTWAILDIFVGATIGVVLLFAIVRLAHCSGALLFEVGRHTARGVGATVDFLAKLYQAAFGLVIVAALAWLVWLYFSPASQIGAAQMMFNHLFPRTGAFLSYFTPQATVVVEKYVDTDAAVSVAKSALANVTAWWQSIKSK